MQVFSWAKRPPSTMPFPHPAWEGRLSPSAGPEAAPAPGKERAQRLDSEPAADLCADTGLLVVCKSACSSREEGEINLPPACCRSPWVCVASGHAVQRGLVEAHSESPELELESA